MRPRALSPLLALLILVLAALACILRPEDVPKALGVKPAFHSIVSLSVSPESGNGMFTLNLTYMLGDYEGGNAYCNTPSPDGKTMELHTIEELGTSDPEKVGTIATRSFQFEVTAPRKDYLVDCHIDKGVTMSATFTVTAPAAGEPEGGQDFTKATLSIQWATMTADHGDKVNIFMCGKTTNTSVSQIELDVIALSALAGDCTFSPDGSGQSPITGSVTGSWSPDSGEIMFRLTSRMTVTGQPSGKATWVVTVANDGPVTFAAPDEAHGTAVWTNTCDADPEVTCYDLSTHKEAGGQVQWTMKFTK